MFGVDPIGYLVQIIKSLNTSGCHRFPERNNANFEFLKICMHHMLGKRPIPDKNGAAANIRGTVENRPEANLKKLNRSSKYSLRDANNNNTHYKH